MLEAVIRMTHQECAAVWLQKDNNSILLICIYKAAADRKWLPVFLRGSVQRQQQGTSCCSPFYTVIIRFESDRKSVITATLPNNRRPDLTQRNIFNSNETLTERSTLTQNKPEACTASHEKKKKRRKKCVWKGKKD